MYRISTFLTNFALALLSGAVIATLWVNLSPETYYDMIEWRLADPSLPQWIWAGTVTFTPFMVVTDILMSVFFFLVGKELWEALAFERGNLAGRQGVLPMGMALGGILGAAGVWLVLQALIETAEEAVMGGGWTVPLGSDTVLVYLFARLAFQRGHPALHFALLIAIAMDILALLTLGLSNPHLSIRLLWLALPLSAALTVWAIWGRAPAPLASEQRRRAGRVIWPYLIAGLISWFGWAASGLPASLGLLPLIPAIAHANRSFGVFAEAEELLHDPLNRLVHLLVKPVALILFLFGLMRGGVDLLAFTPTTLVTLGSLWLGKPLGLTLALLVLLYGFGWRLPHGIGPRHMAVVIPLLSMAFTVPAVALAAALPGGAMQEAARMGLALSLLAGPFALILAKTLRL